MENNINKNSLSLIIKEKLDKFNQKEKKTVLCLPYY